MRRLLLLLMLLLPPGGWSDEPLLLDLSPWFWERFATPTRTNRSFLGVLGRREFDGIPFQVDGRACLYGKIQGGHRGKSEKNLPDIVGVPVGRAFDELHLLHATQWSDVEGMVVALARLNYADGTHHDFQIGYGVHVRDWQRLTSEEREDMADDQTKVIWRGPGMAHFKSTQRMFKSRFCNPHPEKVVETIDFISTEQIASYDLSAATVVNRSEERPETPAVPLPGPPRQFDGWVVARIVDPAGRPVEDAYVHPSLSVPGSSWYTAATPFYTGPDGTGTARYSRAQSASVILNVYKPGWQSTSKTLHFGYAAGPATGMTVTIRLTPDPDEIER